MNDTKKIKMLTDALREAVEAMSQEEINEQSNAMQKNAIASAEAVLAMVEDDGASGLLASLPELTPALRMAGAIVAKYGLTDGLSVSQACGRIHELAELLDTLSTREASTDAR